jgi:hypothetical protein
MAKRTITADTNGDTPLAEDGYDAAQSTAAAAVNSVPDSAKPDVATAAVQALPDSARADFAAATVHALPDAAKADVAAAAVEALPDATKAGVAAAAAQALPDVAKAGVATAMMQALPDVAKANLATAVMQELPDAAQADATAAAVRALPEDAKGELIQRFAPDQAVTNDIWRWIVMTFAFVLGCATVAMMAAVLVSFWRKVDTALVQMLLTIFTTTAGILAGFVSGRASTSRAHNA